MKKKFLDKNKKAKPGEYFPKETVRVRYENMKSDQEKEAMRQRGDDLVDIKIKKAMTEGQFDNLPGKGKPLDLSKYFEIPEHLRVAYQMLKNSGFVPEEVRLKKEMGVLKEKIKQCESEDAKQKIKKQLIEVSQQYNFYMEYNMKFKKTLY
jgi:hypothetical protein